MTIAENVARVREEIRLAAQRCGRNSEEITLVAVSKMNDYARVREAIEAGMAKPMPCPLAIIAVLIPTTLPCILRRGPPLLPGLIEASVCRKLSKGPDLMSRPLAERMPAVTV